MRAILLFLLTACTLPVCGQISIGVIGGYSHTSLKLADQFAVYTTNIIPPPIPESRYVSKWHAGLIADIHLIKRFYVQPQLLFSKKGAKLEARSSVASFIYESDQYYDLTYLELPVNILYKIPTGSGRLALGAGAYYARALSGKYNYRISERNQDGSIHSLRGGNGKIPFNKDDHKKDDNGLNFIAGYECKNGLIFNINYSLGLTDIYTFPINNEKRKNHYFGLSAGYLLKL